MSSKGCGESSCDAPYRKTDKCGKTRLNVEAPPCLLEDKVQKALYRQLYKAILEYFLEDQVYLLEKTPVTDPRLPLLYNNFVTLICQIFHITLGESSKERVVVTESDGTVILDTSKPASVNTVENWLSGTIGPNHNTRVAIMSAQMRSNGVGYEKKFSSTVGQFRTYVAIRLGRYLNNAGTIRISLPLLV